jgi:hypothetical protein
MLAQIATAFRTGCDHFETGPRSVDAQSKDWNASAILPLARGGRL